MKRLGMWVVMVLAVVLLVVAVAGQSAPEQVRAGCAPYIWNNMQYMGLVVSAPHAKNPKRWRCIYEFAEAPAGVITPTPYPTSSGAVPPSNGG